MDWKRNYHKLLQCKQPHEKRCIRRETSFAIVSKMAIFGKTAKGDHKKILKNGRFFGQASEGCKMRNTSRTIL